MDYKYSASTGWFYPADDLEMYGENLPTDLVDVAAETYAALFSAQAAGQRIIPDASGHPIAAAQLPPSLEQLQSTRDNLLRDAALRIAPLQDAVDIGDASPAEEAKLLAWKTYRIALNRMDFSASPNINWPVPPGP